MPKAFDLKINQKKLVHFLNTRPKQYLAEVERLYRLEGAFFIGDITDRWYSGRNSDGTGLFRRSGSLAKGWEPDVFPEGLDVVLRIKNPVFYGKFHEAPSENSKLKKRTFVTEDFKEEMIENLTRATSEAMKVF